MPNTLAEGDIVERGASSYWCVVALELATTSGVPDALILTARQRFGFRPLAWKRSRARTSRRACDSDSLESARRRRRRPERRDFGHGQPRTLFQRRRRLRTSF